MVAQGLASSREVAARMVLAGGVIVNGTVIDKPSRLVARDAQIEIEKPAPYVSRSGEKLAAALDRFRIDPAGAVCLDVGCSTGGFTDCLLQRGGLRIYAIDVGYGLIDWKLRRDPRVVLMERTNIRYVDRSMIRDMIDLAVIDVSFISLLLVLPSVASLMRDGATVVLLVKPQFEVGKGEVGKGGIVRDDDKRRAVTLRVVEAASRLGFALKGIMDSPVKGRKGNREILVALECHSKMGAGQPS
jgi:23S rRNA (cytidine1920-2'-O)/16S rRNA (cytidine1409-2'-O)-methyltransferase